MNKINIQFYKSPFGELLLGSFEDQLCLCDWRYRKKRDEVDRRIQQGLKASFLEEDSKIIQQTRQQLTGYFNGKRKEFDIPLIMTGTLFQKEIWNELLKIPYGTTISYLELSEKIATKESIRAVASANGLNTISILIPCHRVIGSNGELVGYAGGLDVKRKLLELESGITPPKQLELFKF